MKLLYRIIADAIVVAHFGYVAFVILGLVAILIGAVMHWRWVRRPMFRSVHLLAILIVVAESLYGITCPLTTWEQSLRQLAGQASYQGDFIANCVHNTLFFDAEPWVFTLCYTLFGLAVLAAFILVPPDFARWRTGRTESDQTPPSSGSSSTHSPQGVSQRPGSS